MDEITKNEEAFKRRYLKDSDNHIQQYKNYFPVVKKDGERYYPVKIEQFWTGYLEADSKFHTYKEHELEEIYQIAKKEYAFNKDYPLEYYWYGFAVRFRFLIDIFKIYQQHYAD